MIKLDEIVRYFDLSDEDAKYYYDFDKKEIFLIEEEELINLEEDELEELFETVIELPNKDNINDYEIKKEFVENIKDNSIYVKLLNALESDNNSSDFEKICTDNEIINDWNKFKYEKYKGIAINWCKTNNIEYQNNL